MGLENFNPFKRKNVENAARAAAVAAALGGGMAEMPAQAQQLERPAITNVQSERPALPNETVARPALPDEKLERPALPNETLERSSLKDLEEGNRQ